MKGKEDEGRGRDRIKMCPKDSGGSGACQLLKQAGRWVTQAEDKQGLEEEDVLLIELGCGKFEVPGNQPGWEFRSVEEGLEKLCKHLQYPEFQDPQN